MSLKKMKSITILSLILECKWKYKKIYIFTILLNINYFFVSRNQIVNQCLFY